MGLVASLLRKETDKLLQKRKNLAGETDVSGI
jgi:hypothetical protein